MRRFFLKAFLLSGPFLAFLLYVEIGLSGMQTNYKSKRQGLEAHLKEAEVLILGSSLSYFGLNPAYFDFAGFNVAYRAQSYFYDLEIFKKYGPEMPNLKAVLIPVIYFTATTDSESNHADAWRQYFYNQYFGLPLPSDQNFDLHKRLDVKRFSKIALFGDRTFDYFKHGFSEKIDDASDENGWFDAGPAPAVPDFAKTREGAIAHNQMFSYQALNRNRGILEELIARAKAQGATPVLIQMPMHATYRDLIDRNHYAELKSMVHTLAKQNGVAFYNYIDDKRFAISDFTGLLDHLNRDGATKMSRIVNVEILRPALSPPRRRRDIKGLSF